MNKLQLYITKSFNAYKVLYNINPSEEISRHVRELRRAVEKVHYDSTEKNIFYFASTVDSGTFVTIIRTIPTEPGDHLAAWIYIPNELIIDGQTLEEVVETTARKVSGDKVTQSDVARLRELFSREYLAEQSAPSMTRSNPRGEMAWRSYNGESGLTLTDLLGKGLFQQAYLDYCGVMFIDGDLGIKVDGPDLTGAPLSEQAVILPAEKTAENFTAYVFGRVLDRPLRGSLDANLALVWKRPGFEDVMSQEVITSKEFTPSLPETSGSRKSISASSFQITSQAGGGTLEGCQIMVNGIDVTHEPHLFTESELVSASVVVSCEGCAPYTAHIDLAASTRALIRMQERTKVYCFEMPVKSADIGAPVRFKIYTKRVLDESPLEGYVALDSIQEGESRTNHLACATSATTTIQKAIFAGIGFVVGLLLMFGLSKCGGSEGDPSSVVVKKDTVGQNVEMPALSETVANLNNTPSATTAAPESQPAPETKTNDVKPSQSAIQYLDKNKVWSREKMEAYPELKGLYDDINNFRYDKLTGQWADKLSGSKEYARVVKHTKQGARKKRPEPGSTTMSGNGEFKVQSFLNRVDP